MGKWFDIGNDIVGREFGWWVVIAGASVTRGHVFVECKCSCGEVKKVRVEKLMNGSSQSCGCKRDEALTTHGQTKNAIRKDSREYWIWNSMKQRCLNPNSSNYENYGGRGIKVCDRWLSFENFHEDMGEKPEGKSLDRKDNDGDYSPENCVWADRDTQNNNKRNCHYIEVDGVEKTITQWSKETGISHSTIHLRLKAGWSAKDAVTLARWHRPN